MVSAFADEGELDPSVGGHPGEPFEEVASLHSVSVPGRTIAVQSTEHLDASVRCFAMSRKKKQSHAQKVRGRIERQLVLNGQSPQASGAFDAMSPAAQANFIAAAELAVENPPWLAEMLMWTDENWTPVLAGIADTVRFNFPREQVLDNAWRYIVWAILNKVPYLFDWAEPVYDFTPEAFVDRLRQGLRESHHSNE